MSIWVQFPICALIILLCGYKLSHYADRIAERTGLAKSWIGVILLATTTSIPELVSSVSAVTLHDLPNMAVGGIVGACLFNLAVIGILDFFSSKPVSHVVQKGHIISAGFGVVLLGLTALDILFGRFIPIVEKANKSDPMSFVFIAVYLVAMRMIYSYETTLQEESSARAETEVAAEKKESLLKLVSLFGLLAAVLVGAACYLPDLGAHIAAATGWHESFIGSSFIAVTTALPELSVAISAARRGSFDLAIASLLGSNLFNIFALAITDFCYTKAALLRSIAEVNTLAALAAIVSTGIVVIALTYSAKKKFLFLAGDALALFLVYVFANVLLFVAQ
jgi:cation:H+ antiporter